MDDLRRALEVASGRIRSTEYEAVRSKYTDDEIAEVRAVVRRGEAAPDARRARLAVAMIREARRQAPMDEALTLPKRRRLRDQGEQLNLFVLGAAGEEPPVFTRERYEPGVSTPMIALGIAMLVLAYLAIVATVSTLFRQAGGDGFDAADAIGTGFGAAAALTWLNVRRLRRGAPA